MKKILIVDDVKGWRDYHTGIVEELFNGDVEVTTANCAKNAYDILMTQKAFDMIITDLQMENDFSPKLAGEWLVEQIKTFNIYLNTRVVIISASYNARNIAENLNIFCIPKSTALTCISAYKEVLAL